MLLSRRVTGAEAEDRQAPPLSPSLLEFFLPPALPYACLPFLSLSCFSFFSFICLVFIHFTKREWALKINFLLVTQSKLLLQISPKYVCSGSFELYLLLA